KASVPASPNRLTALPTDTRLVAVNRTSSRQIAAVVKKNVRTESSDSFLNVPNEIQNPFRGGYVYRKEVQRITARFPANPDSDLKASVPASPNRLTALPTDTRLVAVNRTSSRQIAAVVKKNVRTESSDSFLNVPNEIQNPFRGGYVYRKEVQRITARFPANPD